MIYLCIPAYNEEQTVGVVLWKIRQVLTDFPRDYQILVADDASTDRTADVLAPYARVLPLTVLRAHERRGYAASLEMLLREAVRRSDYPKRDTIVTLQADFTDEPEDIVPLIKKIEQGADIVGGTRASDRRPELLERLLLGWQQRVLRRGAWPEDAGDPLSGFRSYRVYTVAKALEGAKDSRLLHWDGAVADAELLRATAPHARRVESVDLVFRPDRRQRATRASTWERLQRLRRFVRGAPAVGTVPLAQLSPETVPPPRPLEIERERRGDAVATAGQRRNGTNGARRGGRTSSGRGGRSAESASQSRPQRQRREKPADAQARAPEGTQRRRRKPSEQRQGPAAAGNVAPEPAAAGKQGTDPTVGESAAPKKKRRRRRRKTDASTPEATARPQAAESGTDAVSRGTTESSDVGAAAAEGDAAEGAPKKRRRRGGRRGGRGRRRRTDETGAAAADAGGAPAAASEAGPPATAAARDVEHVSAGDRTDHD